jgi:hypothetical protein
MRQEDTLIYAMRSLKPRLAVFYEGAAGPKIHQIAVEVAARAWDLGCAVRVRRLGDVIVPDNWGAQPEWIEMLAEAADVPEAAIADLEWASLAVVLGHSDAAFMRPARRPPLNEHRVGD